MKLFLRVFFYEPVKGKPFVFDSILNQVVAVLYSCIQESILYKICIEAQQRRSLKFWSTCKII